MFRASIITLAAAAALTANAAFAGGSCSTKYHNTGKWSGQVQTYQQNYSQKVHLQPTYIQPACVEPVTVCYYKLCYQLPCWDYQKHATFENYSEAVQAAQLLYSNGYKVSLSKYEATSYKTSSHDSYVNKYDDSAFPSQSMFQGKLTSSQNMQFFGKP